MTGSFIPILLAIGGIITALIAYRYVQRGGSRFFQMERDRLLRQASFIQLASMVLFAASVGVLLYQQSELQAALENDELALAEDNDLGAAQIEVALATPEIIIESQPPTIAVVPTATEDPDLPTQTPTVELKRAEITGTGASGVYLRGTASTSGEELQILDEGSIVTILNEDIIDADGYKWVNVRTLGGEEGWVAEIFLQPFTR